MNYRHAYHAGNFADVHKHATLTLILRHLIEKAAALRVIDTHAGGGRYDLAGAEAQRTGEWREGIGRLLAARLSEPVRALLAPYLDAVRALNPEGGCAHYPGSPLLAAALLRAQDRLIACEKEPSAFAALARACAAARGCKALPLDGWTALGAYVPPKERRGLVVVDPPFEQPGELERLAGHVAQAWRKWPTGVYLLWFPVKQGGEGERLVKRLSGAGLGKLLRTELVAARPSGDRLAGSGLIVINPPWRLAQQLEVLAPALANILAQDEGARATTERYGDL